LTELELRLLTMATLAATPAELVDVYSEPIVGAMDGARLYTVELVTNEGTRTFGLHGRSLAAAEPLVVLRELKQRFAAPAALPRPE
jgi:hypothetical protein